MCDDCHRLMVKLGEFVCCYPSLWHISASNKHPVICLSGCHKGESLPWRWPIPEPNVGLVKWKTPRKMRARPSLSPRDQCVKMAATKVPGLAPACRHSWTHSCGKWTWTIRVTFRHLRWARLPGRFSETLCEKITHLGLFMPLLFSSSSFFILRGARWVKGRSSEKLASVQSYLIISHIVRLVLVNAL